MAGTEMDKCRNFRIRGEAMNIIRFVSHLVLILVFAGSLYSAEENKQFELFPPPPDKDPEQLRQLAEYFEGLEAVKPIPKTHGRIARLIITADRGDLDICICDPIVVGGIEEKSIAVVRVRERVGATFGIMRGWCVPVDFNFRSELFMVTQDILCRTSYASGVASVAGIGAQFDFSSAMLGGTCFNPPTDSHVGKLADIWIGLAEWCSMDDEFRANNKNLVDKVKALREIVDSLDPTLAIPKHDEVSDYDSAAGRDFVSGDIIIKRLVSKQVKGESKLRINK